MFNKLFTRSRKSSTINRRSASFRPSLESLEARVVMDAALPVGGSAMDYYAPPSVAGVVGGTAMDYYAPPPASTGAAAQPTHVELPGVGLVSIDNLPTNAYFVPVHVEPIPDYSALCAAHGMPMGGTMIADAGVSDMVSPGAVPYTGTHAQQLEQLQTDIGALEIQSIGRQRTLEVIGSNGQPVTVTTEAGPGTRGRADGMYTDAVAFEQRLNALIGQARTGHINTEQLRALRFDVTQSQMTADGRLDPRRYQEPSVRPTPSPRPSPAPSPVASPATPGPKAVQPDTRSEEVKRQDAEMERQLEALFGRGVK